MLLLKSLLDSQLKKINNKRTFTCCKPCLVFHYGVHSEYPLHFLLRHHTGTFQHRFLIQRNDVRRTSCEDTNGECTNIIQFLIISNQVCWFCMKLEESGKNDLLVIKNENILKAFSCQAEIEIL